MGLPTAGLTTECNGVDECEYPPKEGTGMIIDGAGTVFREGLPIAGITNIVIFPKTGKTGMIISGSGTVFREGLPIARILDEFIGCYSGIIIGGAGTVFTG